MWKSVGLFRTREGMEDAVAKLEAAYVAHRRALDNARADDADAWKQFNLVTVARLIARAALRRQESRGAHYRQDFPERDDVNWKIHLVDHIDTALDHVRSKRVKALGISSAQRSPHAPDIPTIAESGVPGFEAIIWQGVLAPAGTPSAIVDRLNREIGNALASAELRKQFTAAGVDPMPSTPGEFRRTSKPRSRNGRK